MNHITRYARWLQWPLALAILCWLFARNREAIGDLSGRAVSWDFAVLALVLAGGSTLLTFVRWYLLVWAQEFRFRVRDAVRLGFVGYLFNFVLPAGAVGGDFVKALMIAREQRTRRTVAVATILLDRVLGLLALFMVGAAVSLFQSPATDHPLFRATAAVFWVGSLAGLTGLAVMLHPAVPRHRWLNRLVHLRFIGRPIAELLGGILLYQSRRRVLLAVVAISLVGHLSMLSAFYCCARAVNGAADVPDYAAHLLFIPAAEIASMLPITPAGVGTLEAAIEELYRQAGAAAGAGLMTGIAFRVITLLIAAVGAAYYLASRREIKTVLKESAERSTEPQPTKVGA